MRHCLGCGVGIDHLHPNRKYCTDRCKWRTHANGWYHRLHPDAQYRGPWPSRGPRPPCSRCGQPLMRSRSGMCGPCFRATHWTKPKRPYVGRALASRIGWASRLPKPTLGPAPIGHYSTCCGPMLKVLHDPRSERHRLGVNAYMREYQRTHLNAYYRRYLGTVSEREELPSALVELAVMRRRLQEATKQVGNWRTNGQVDDPS